MVSVSDAIRIAVTADGKQAVSEFKKVGASAKSSLSDAEKHGKSLSTTLTKVGIGAVGAGATIAGGLFVAAKAASEAQLAHDKLNNTIKNSPQLAGASVAAFNKQQKAIEGVTVADDEAVAGVQALLGQFKLTQSQILQVTPLVVDLSRKMGIDLDSAAKAVGKAIDGSAGGLKRYGIIVDVTKGGTNNLAHVVDGLRHTVGGFATTEGKTFTGQLEIAKNKIHDTEEAIGAGAIPVITKLAGVAQGAAKGFLYLDDATGGAVGKFAAYGSVALIAGGAISLVAGQVTKLVELEGVLQAKLGFTTAAASADAAAMDGLATSEAAAGAGAVQALGPLGTLAGALAIVAGSSHDVKDRVDGLPGSFDHLGDSATGSARTFQSAVTKAFTSTIGANKDLQSELARSGLSASGLAKAMLAHGLRGFEEYTSGAHLSTDALIKLTDIALAASPQIASASRKEATAEVEANQKREQSTHKLNKRILDGGHYYNTWGLSAWAAARAQDGANKSTELGASDIDKLNSKMLTLSGIQDTIAGKQRSAAENYLRVDDALATVTQDQADYNKAVKEHGRNSVEAQSALRKTQEDFLGVGDAVATAKQSYIDAAAAQSGYTIGGKNSTRANNDFIWSLQQMANKTTGPVHDAIEDFLKGLHKIPAKKDVKVTADTSEARASIGSFANDVLIYLNSLGLKLTGAEVVAPSKLLQPGGKHGDKFRASGGPVTGGESYIVGEKGPELFVPRASGTIIPNGRMRSGGGGVGTTNVTINVHGGDPNQVVDALKRYMRTNGTVPIKVAA